MSQLDRASIAMRVPHAGAMCLLERVVDWDDAHIRCMAISHRAADNPLREVNRLPVWAGVEYAAQAAAVHSALKQSRVEPREGVLAALRNIEAQCDRLDCIEGELTIDATLRHGDAAGAIYAFEVHGD